MRDKFLALPLAQKAAALAALFSVIATLVLILASHQGLGQLIHQSSELFGESLVQQLSRDASSPLVQGDKLSLQSLLNEFVESPLVAHGTIYDVENRPIAEAGKPMNGQDLSASITFQDSIAGYAVVTFDTRQLQRRALSQSWQQVALALLLAALVYVLALYPGRQLSAIVNDLILIAGTPTKRRRANTQVAYHGDDELRELARVLLSGPVESSSLTPNRDYALLVIDITNLPSLQVNLGQQALAHALQSLQRQLKTICRLYDGELEASRSHCFSACFCANDDDSNYPFRALCSAFLIEQSLADGELPFDIRQAVVTNDSTLSKLEPVTGKQRTIEQGLLLASALSDGIAVSERVYQHRSVEHRVQAIPLDNSLTADGTVRVSSLDSTYQQLLDRQFHTLRQTY